MTATPLQRRILDLSDGTMTRTEIAAAVGVTPKAVSEVMSRLRALGYAGDFRRKQRIDVTPSDNVAREWLMTFWFRGAKCYKPMLAHELVRRGLHEASLAYLIKQRLVAADRMQDGKTMCYTVTSLGRDFVGDVG